MINMGNTTYEIEPQEKIKAKRGTAIYMRFVLSELELSSSNSDLIKQNKQKTESQLGQVVSDSLDIWDETTNEDTSKGSKEFEARLIICKEHDYKQMVGLINQVLKDSDISPTEHNQVIDLLFGLIH